MKRVGTILFEQGSIDVTDPCYNNYSVLNTRIHIKPGLYNCYVHKIGTCIKAIEIKRTRYGNMSGSYVLHNITTTDSGIIGFFENKKNYSDKEWQEFRNFLVEENKKDPTKRHYFKDNGFFASSGISIYRIYIKTNINNEIVQVKIKFL